MVMKRPLLESEIIAAQKIGKSANECAKILGVHFTTYKKYAVMYGLFEKVLNKKGAGVKKTHSPSIGKYPIEEVLKGTYNNNKYLTPILIYKRIVRAGIREDKCEICGFSEKRVVDGKAPLLLMGKDGNRKNFHSNNLEIVCYNCFHNFYNGFSGRPKAKVKNEPSGSL
jgi:hypothetical protein